MTSHPDKFRNLITYLKKIVLQSTDNRMMIYGKNTPSERKALDEQYVKLISIRQRISKIRVNQITPNRIFS